MEKVFFDARGALPVNFVIREAISNNVESLMVRIPLQDQLTKTDLDIMRAYKISGSSVCSICKLASFEHIRTYSLATGECTVQCSSCEKEDFMENAHSLRYCGFHNSPDPGACFD